MAGAKPSERRNASLDEEIPEPDLVPMMNLNFSLILALLSMAAFLPLGLISVQAPNLGGGGASSDPPPEEKKPKLNLTVFVTKDGFNIGASGATLKGPTGGPLLPKIAGAGEKVYDFAGLNKKLGEIKKNFPLEDNVIITADPTVIYQDVIYTMDACRESAKGDELFPAVAFSAGIVG